MSDHRQGAIRLGLIGATLGAAAGCIELLTGTTRWTGNKDDPVMLGFATLFLAGIIALTAWDLTTVDLSPGRHVRAPAGFALPSMVGLTTAGLAWAPAAVFGLAAGFLALRELQARQIFRVLSDNVNSILLSVLSLIYLVFGAVASPGKGSLGIIGSLCVTGALVLRSRSRRAAWPLAILGTIPFAVAAFSSVVIPFTALLVFCIGTPYLLQQGRPSRRRL
jgi:hypothetical protein